MGDHGTTGARRTIFHNAAFTTGAAVDIIASALVPTGFVPVVVGYVASNISADSIVLWRVDAAGASLWRTLFLESGVVTGNAEETRVENAQVYMPEGFIVGVDGLGIEIIPIAVNVTMSLAIIWRLDRA